MTRNRMVSKEYLSNKNWVQPWTKVVIMVYLNLDTILINCSHFVSCCHLTSVNRDLVAEVVEPHVHYPPFFDLHPFKNPTTKRRLTTEITLEPIMEEISMRSFTLNDDSSQSCDTLDGQHDEFEKIGDYKIYIIAYILILVKQKPYVNSGDARNSFIL